MLIRRLLDRFFAKTSAARGREARVDPRTDHLYSLRNLLNIRAGQHDWPVMAVGTSSDVLFAASDESQVGEELLISCKEAVRAGLSQPASLHFAVGGQILVLAVDGYATTPTLLEVAECVRRIIAQAA